GYRHGDGRRARRDARRHAPVAQPCPVERILAFRMVLPGIAAARPIAFVVQSFGAVSAHRARHTLHRPGLYRAGRQRANHALYGGATWSGLNEAAYSAEIIRAGIISIDHGQTEAA